MWLLHTDPIEAPGTANMAFAANTVAQEHDCFALVLEQPFKDCAENPGELSFDMLRRPQDMPSSLAFAVGNLLCHL